jgi:hypothetical protein
MPNSIYRKKRYQTTMRKIDWDIFWFREVLFLSLPLLLAVLTLPRGDHIRAVRLGVLLVILLGLTLFNAVWAWFRSSQ